MRVALGLEYDGSKFSGWQSQPGGSTVQDVLETALSEIACRPVRTVCAGRTDTGVHALCQVIHFDTDAERPSSAWVRGTNAHLPTCVAVRWALPVSDKFNARFSAQARSYRYLLLNRSQRPGVWAGKLGWYHRALDIAAMRQASRCLLGEHDFSSFRSAECQARTPMKNLHDFQVDCRGDLVEFKIRANAFLHHMVRNLVGALVYVGSGRLSPQGLVELLAARDRRQAPPTFMPDGLYLAGIEYGSEWGLPQEGRIIAAPEWPI